ncbi:MAG: phosphate acyltransferase PlsX [Deltaproteobacteria bacterium]|nr:MAG: phosphate acyltransferase PlsX [Deltaproteobacteria bacterium]
MRIALDAMGGDLGPEVVVEGAVLAARERGVHVTLVGDRDLLTAELERHDVRGLPLTIHHASEVVTMDDSPSVALRRKKDSSMRVSLDLVKEGEANAAVSAGNSGAFMAKAMLVLRPLEGVERPAIATLMPSLSGSTVVLDVVANVDCSPKHLVQFAVMGEVFAHDALGITSPKVGLLSNGTESSKGTDLTRKAHELIERLKLNYVGYVEGRDVFTGEVDVVVTDGFTGNVMLKASEGIARVIGKILKSEMRATWVSKLGYILGHRAFKKLRSRIDYREVGGAPLLGLNGIAVICHGSSDALAIKSAIAAAARYAENRIDLHMLQKLAAYEDQEIWASSKERHFWKSIKEKIISPKREDEEK